ncbi:hypothetical protein K4F52_003150 [Lecanicillium sp. MT-2017a]|nr:hypothetical protein K4F52_003150 [Lecanicillium sp. MT-2017a]
MAVQDAQMFADVERGNDLATKLYPENAIKTSTMPTAEAKAAGYKHDLHGAVEQHGAGALWPYRLVTKLFAELLERYSSRFSLETNTPALSIDFVGGDDAQYHIITPRGTIHTKKIVHCTNGFTGHLLPRLVGAIYPFRGTMSVQEPGPEFSRLGDRISWSWLRKPTFDADTQVFSTGLYYAQQNAHTGKLFIGGERQKIADMLSSDDSVVADEARESLLCVLPQLLNNVEPVGEQTVWSGIMGFSSDGLPLAGKLEESVTNRGGDGEWIAAGFNGHGMDKCWLTGVAVAQMVIGQPETVGLPAAFLLTPERRKRLGLEQSVEYWLQTLSQSA